jgi:hypothetical protein
MSVDYRTRSDDAARSIDPHGFFAHDLPAALEAARALIERGAAHLRLRPLAIETDGEAWSLEPEGTNVRVRPGVAAGAAHVRLTQEQLGDLVHDQATPMTFFVGGALDMPEGGLSHLLDWWLVLRGALDAQPLHVPGAIAFTARDGAALDLGRTFRPDDAPEELSHFLHQAGYLHLAGMFSEEWMARIAADMDRAAPSFQDGDGRSWWATTADGRRRVVRMQGFDELSAATAELLRDGAFLRLGAIPGDGHVHTGLEGNRVEALVKPLGVVEGISDVPWHKDCSLGRHSYECCSLTVGISVTGADADSGQLRVVAGSHRALVWPALADPARLGLPDIALPTRTGDVTLHLSCALHMSQPPRARERRVLYTSFRLPARSPAAAAAARARIRAVREGAYTKVFQEPVAGG